MPLKRHLIFVFLSVLLGFATAGAAFSRAAAHVSPPKRSLTVSVVGGGRLVSRPKGISCRTTCSARFARGTKIRLTATPRAGWEFSGWSGACRGSATCVVTLTVAKVVIGAFKKIPPPAPPPPPPPPPPAATPGHYKGTTADNEIWDFDIGPDGLTLLNLSTGSMNEKCDPHDYDLYGGNLNYKGPMPVSADGSFEINNSWDGTVGGSVPAHSILKITGHVANGIASGTYHEDTSFFDNNTQYACTTGDQTWTASLTP